MQSNKKIPGRPVVYTADGAARAANVVTERLADGQWHASSELSKLTNPWVNGAALEDVLAGIGAELRQVEATGGRPRREYRLREGVPA